MWSRVDGILGIPKECQLHQQGLTWVPMMPRLSDSRDNKDVIVLPEHLFVNLIDMELQKKIANI
jgi:hypothetical protein